MPADVNDKKDNTDSINDSLKINVVSDVKTKKTSLKTKKFLGLDEKSFSNGLLGFSNKLGFC